MNTLDQREIAMGFAQLNESGAAGRRKPRSTRSIHRLSLVKSSCGSRRPRLTCDPRNEKPTGHPCFQHNLPLGVYLKEVVVLDGKGCFKDTCTPRVLLAKSPRIKDLPRLSQSVFLRGNFHQSEKIYLPQDLPSRRAHQEPPSSLCTGRLSTPNSNMA